MDKNDVEQNAYTEGYDLGYRKGYSDGSFNKEDSMIKFYYSKDTDKHYVGKRLDTMYYAEIIVYPLGEIALDYKMSRFLPWGEIHNGYCYPEEPKEISFEEWMRWFIGYIKNNSSNNLRGEI